MGVKREQLKEIFTYHAPDDDQVPKYAKIRLAGQALAEVILECTPVCGDQQVGDSESARGGRDGEHGGRPARGRLMVDPRRGKLAPSGLSYLENAAVAHEADRAYCRGLGGPSQPNWGDWPDWQGGSGLLGGAA